MKIWSLVILFISICLTTFIYANPARQLVVVINNSGESEGSLIGYPGYCWAKAADKIYLDAYDADIAWLNNHSIEYKSQVLPDEINTLYINYFIASADLSANPQILDSGPGYILATTKIPGAVNIWPIFPKKLPFVTPHYRSPDIAASYDPLIDSLINQVDQDTLLYYLRNLTGETAVEFNGQNDTITSRFTLSPGNILAGEYLKYSLENYGYQVEFHNFIYNELVSITSYGANHCWAISESERQLFRTSDGGASWKITNLDYGTFSGSTIANYGNDSVWVTCMDAVVMFSSDGGNSFTQRYVGAHSALWDCQFVTPLKGYITNSFGNILYTTDAGVEWSALTLPVAINYGSLCFVDSLYGWAVGLGGTIIATTDGGYSWNLQNSTTTASITDVDFTDRYNGWAVGLPDVILHTSDGGITWKNIYLPGGYFYWQVDFYDVNHGVIVIRDGPAQFTTDGGITWQTHTPDNDSHRFWDVSMRDSLTTYAVGKNLLLKTSDCGMTWLDQSPYVTDCPKNIIATKPSHFYPDNQIIICGHYDAAGYNPGADDNGSGTIGVLEIARVLASRDFSKTIKFCLWSGEEEGMVGSIAYARDAYMRGDNISAIINLDMISYDGNADDSIEFHCGTYGENIALGEIFSQIISEYEIPLYPTIRTTDASGSSDHSSFWSYGYPAMMGIEGYHGDFNPYYHSSGDIIAHIRMPYFANYVKAALGTVAELATPIGPCNYFAGDINNDGNTVGSDVTYGVRYLKGIGSPPPVYCYDDSLPGNHPLYPAGDVNNDCQFRGSDITRLVAYFKGLATLEYCHLLPPALPLRTRGN